MTNKVGYAILNNLDDNSFEPFEIYIMSKSWCHLLFNTKITANLPTVDKELSNLLYKLNEMCTKN